MPTHSLSSPRRTKQQTCRPSLSLLAGGACRTNNTLSHPAQQALPLGGIRANEAVPCMQQKVCSEPTKCSGQHINYAWLPCYMAGPSGRVGLRPLACWECVFESHRGHGCLSVVSVVCCQVEVSATSWSLV